MNQSQKVLSDIVIYNKYGRYQPSLQRRENWTEIVDRYLRMMLKKYGKPNDLLLFDIDRQSVDNAIQNNQHSLLVDAIGMSEMAYEILHNGQYLYRKDVLPSMRAAQFGGVPVFKNNSRVYNCAFLPIDNIAAFSETMFLLLGGTGVGYSVQFSHVAKLPLIHKTVKERKFLIGDSIEGWADSIKALMYWGLGKRNSKPKFDYSDIRAKGEHLITAGGKAPGPAPLRICHAHILSILESKSNGDKLTSLEVHDIICHIADAVLAGGIRRAALISLFSADDDEMMHCKDGNWWESNPQRGRSNNSAVLLRHRITKEFFMGLWDKISNSYSGEPGIYFSNDLNWGTNPCCEIALRSFQFCNLTEINAGSINESVLSAYNNQTQQGREFRDFIHLQQVELNNRARVASFFGTLQAGFTDFHYLRPIWQETTEKDALVGVGMTGIASGDVLNLNLTEASNVAINENRRVAILIGINSAARVTTIKPSGTTSIVAGSSSGIHAWHDAYYTRNMQVAIGSDLANYFFANHPELIKVMELDSKTAVIGIPQKAPEGAIFREHENAIQMLNRVFKFYDEWVKPGHQSGANTNNVSATVYVDRNKNYKRVFNGNNDATYDWVQDQEAHYGEWEAVGEYLWNNREKFNGMSVLPYDGGNYKNAPFETITEEEFNRIMPFTEGIELDKIKEMEDNTTLSSELACSGGECVVI